MTPKITFVTGPPAAGKSTFVQENKATGDYVVDFDKLAMALGSESSHDAPEHLRDFTAKIRGEADRLLRDMAERDELVQDAWVIQTRLGEWKRGVLEDAGIEIVTIDPGKETVLAQAEQDGRPEWTAAAIEAWYAGLETAEEELVAKDRAHSRREMTYAAKVLAPEIVDGEGGGVFEAIVSVFGNVDLQGDITEKGAFAETIAKWNGQTAKRMPIVWAHQFHDPAMYLGIVESLEETEQGLRVKGRLNLQREMGALVYDLMKEGVISEFSFSGDAVETEPLDPEDPYGWGPARLKKIDLWEVGPCFKGANPLTSLLSMKALTSKEGRVLAARHVEDLKAAHKQLGDVISAVEPKTSTDQIQAAPEPGPVSTKTDEPGAAGPSKRTLIGLRSIL